MSHITSAPSNIALIKYMGKARSDQNLPINSSLSYTLKHLRSYVRLTQKENGGVTWAPLIGDSFQPIKLSENGVYKFIRHFEFLKEFWQLNDEKLNHYLIESANNFPSDCGLASSASSFAALTMAAARELRGIDSQNFLVSYKDKNDQNLNNDQPSQGSQLASRDLSNFKKDDLAILSSKGSGSSCRSFFEPWGLWSVNGFCCEVSDIPYQELIHLVILVEDQKKAISSSDAHRLVIKSSSFVGRPERAESRLINLLKNLREKNWKESYHLVWDEFMDMHELFHNCTPSFSYISEGSRVVLKVIQSYWEIKNDGPLVTMDAGPNVHLLFRMECGDMANELKNKLGIQFKILDSRTKN